MSSILALNKRFSISAMPALVDTADHPAKRKRGPAKEKPLKRVRSESAEKDPQAQIFLLENEVLESRKHYNNITKLIKILQADSEDGDIAVVAAISLCRIFTRLMVSGELTKKQTGSEKEAGVISWLRERYLTYKLELLKLLSEDGVESTALTLCMRLLKTEGEHLLNGQDYHFPTVFLADILNKLLTAINDGSTRQEFAEKFVEEYDDIRFYTFEAIE
jgi:U3 small nucleolar RNA-associated protein 19